MKTYMFSWNGRRKFIDASTYSEARRKFRKQFGFFPDNTVKIVVWDDGDLTTPYPTNSRS